MGMSGKVGRRRGRRRRAKHITIIDERNKEKGQRI
jgi:hypothetical protein